MTISEVELSYWGGIIDGEGCISINRITHKDYKREGYQLRIAVCITHEPTTKQLKEAFGGAITFTPRKRGKDAWQWTITSNKALDMLEEIYPFLRIKKEQAKLGIEFQRVRSSRSATRKTDDEWDAENKIFLEIKNLNKRWSEDDPT